MDDAAVKTTSDSEPTHTILFRSRDTRGPWRRDYNDKQPHFTPSPRSPLGRGHSFDLGPAVSAYWSDRNWVASNVGIHVGGRFS